jgi:molybdate transport system permease protein
VLLPLAAVAVAFVVLPFAALLQRTPWSDLLDLLGRPIVTDALRLSMVSALAAVVLSLLFGVPLAWVLARRRSGPVTAAGRRAPADGAPAGGGRRVAALRLRPPGLLGGPVYDATGFLLPFSIWGVIVANTFVALPFLVITVEAGLRAADTRYEDAAATLGAGRWMILRRVTLPLVAPSLLAGAVLSWARALGEFGATVTFAATSRGAPRRCRWRCSSPSSPTGTPPSPSASCSSPCPWS